MGFFDLKKESLKYDFPLPNNFMILDYIMRHDLFFFIEKFHRYNQIFINHQDQYTITFTTAWRTFFCMVMPFGLNNPCTTYQRGMKLIFRDYIDKILEDYIGDILAKSLT
jgi:hypothetical protein